jgi:hypothetical protein
MSKHFRTAAFVVLGLLLVTSAHGGRRGGGGGYRGAAVGPRGGTVSGGAYRGAASGYRGTATYGGRYGSAHGPYGGAAVGGARGGSYTTPGGTTVRHGSVGGAAVGPGGRVAAGGRSATTVTGPGGRTVATGSRGGVASGYHGTVAGGSRAGVASGYRGTVAGGTRAGVAVGPRGAVAGGTRAVGARGYATDAGLARYTTRGVAVGGAAYSTRYVSRTGFATQAGYVRRGWVYTGSFSPSWYRAYPGVWRGARWAVASVWAAPAYAVVADYCALPPEPIYYDYGSTVVYRDNYVYVNGDQTVPVTTYAEQAISLADAGAAAEPDEKDEWQPLGVFAMVQGEEKMSGRVFQLAVNRAGIIRGNYYDAVGDNASPLSGKVDRKTQRAAWTIGKKKDTVFEVGIANLSRPETTMLVHFGKDRTQQWGLVRLEEEGAGKSP